MAIAQNERERTTSEPRGEPTNIPVLSNLLSVLLKVLSVSILAGFIAVLIEFCLFFFVEDPVAASLRRYQSVSQFLSGNWLNEDTLLRYVEFQIMRVIDVESVNAWIRSISNQGAAGIAKYYSYNPITDWIINWIIKLLQAIPDLFTLWIIVTFTWLAKITSVTSIIPPCGLIIATGFIDGTVERKINTFKGKRDSEDKIEWWFLLFKSSSYSVLFLYVALPHSFQAPTVLFPSAILSAIFLRNVVANYKKYW